MIAFLPVLRAAADDEHEHCMPSDLRVPCTADDDDYGDDASSLHYLITVVTKELATVRTSRCPPCIW